MHFLLADACIVNAQNIIVLPFSNISYLMLSGHQRCIFVQFYVFMGLEQYAIGVV
jgi:hypothetical protein